MDAPTEEQAAIIDYVAGGKGNLIVEALAGSGKTSTILAALSSLPQPTALLCAFNKRIADELATKVPKRRGLQINVKTFHALGLSIIKAHHRHLTIDSAATEDLINLAAGSIPFKLRRAAVRVLRVVKDNYADLVAPTQAKIEALGLEHDCFKALNDLEIKACVEIVSDAYILSLDLKNRKTIDFCDMVWAPVVLDLAPPSRFKAVFVDELQDISKPQLAMLRKLMPKDGRFIGVGDRQQSIYQWRGADPTNTFAIIEKDLNAHKLPLTITWRCGTNIVRQANQIVPTLRARPNAPSGIVTECAFASLPAAIATDKRSTFVLSRNNANLLDCALFLWRSRVQFELNAGKELLEPLFIVLDQKLDLSGKQAFLDSLGRWQAHELERAEKAKAPAYADRIEEQAAMLRAAANYAEPRRIRELLTDMIKPNDSGVLLSTVHKVKGLEAERVFLLKQTFTRHQIRPCKFCQGSGYAEFGSTCRPCSGSGAYAPDPEPEELNIEYVAITRAIDQLVWVDLSTKVSVAGLAPAELVASQS